MPWPCAPLAMAITMRLSAGYTTNHQDIGTLYLLLSLGMFLVGGSPALLIRAELFQPGLQLMKPDFFNQLATMHGLILIFGVVMPAWTGLANWQIPMMVGTPDMALMREAAVRVDLAVHWRRTTAAQRRRSVVTATTGQALRGLG